jgi:PAS domain S-box-containing protein
VTSARDEATLPPGPGNKAKLDFVSGGGGEMGMRIRSFDWSRTAIGTPERWSPALHMLLRILLANRMPMLLWWGPKFVQFYNDAYLSIPGTKHPAALGQEGSECWPEVWHILAPLVQTPFEGGEATWIEDLQLELRRSGFSEETHFTVAYSPVPDETAPGGIGGVLATVHEISEKVIGERRVNILRDLGSRAAEARTAEEACCIAATTLSKHPKDIPFALLYLMDETRDEARLAATCGFPDDLVSDTVNPAVIRWAERATESVSWPLQQAFDSAQMQIVDDLSSRFPSVPAGPWSDAPHTAVVVPIPSLGGPQFSGFLVAGLSARLRFDDSYRDFLQLATSQIATAIANARAYEEERRRAEALAEIDRAKTAFFSNVSHEFRTPLTLMMGPIEEVLAKEGSIPSAEDREQIATAHRNSLRLLKLVNSLLDFSRSEAGRANASYAPQDLGELTRELASNFRSAIETAHLYLVVDCPTLDQPVFVDREMWEKIVLNLLSNAFKFTFDGGITIRLAIKDENAVLTVADTGVGIPAAHLPHVFERFHRVEGARGRTYEGTGIGLALIQELAKLHGGTVTAESTEGTGSVFSVTIPLGSAHLPQDRVSTQARPVQISTAVRAAAFTEEALSWIIPDKILPHKGASPSQQGDLGQPKRRILLADDNADMRTHLVRLMSPHYEVVAVGDGEAALNESRRCRPDLIVTDVMMPQLDGFGLLEKLRADPTLREIPVILLSARAGDEARTEGIEAGADDYLTKPFSGMELLARIRTTLDLQRVRMESRDKIEQVSARLQSALRAARMVAWELDLTTGNVVRSGNAPEVMGSAIVQPVELSWQQVHPDDVDRARATVAQAVAARGDYVMQVRYVRPDNGAVQWMETHGRVVADPHTGEPTKITGVILDITHRRRMDALITGQKEALERSVSGSDMREALEAIARTATTQSEDSRSAVFLHQPTAACLHVKASSGSMDRFLDSLNGLPVGPESPSCGLAAFIAEPVVVPDIELNEAWKPYAELARQSGVRSCWSQPIRSSGGKVLGTIALYHSTVRTPRPQELDAVNYLAQTAALLIEKHREAEGRLARTAQFETLLNHAPLAVFVVDSDFAVRQVNPIALPVFGDIPDLIGRNFEEVMHILWSNEQAEEIIRLFRRTLDTGESYIDPELVAVRKDLGMVVQYYEWRVDQIPLPDGRFGVVCYFRDISAQVQAREEIARSEHRFRTIANQAPVLIWLADINGKHCWFNEPWLRFTGRSMQQEVDDGWLESVHPEDLQHCLDSYLDAFTKRREFTAEFRLRRFDGEWRWILNQGLPMGGEDGFAGYAGSCIDITGMKQAEVELKRANKALEQFAYSASHDLQEPLRAVKIYSELLTDRYRNKLDSQGVQFLDFVRDGATRMEQLVRDLLTYTQAASLDNTPDLTDSSDALRAALAGLDAKISESGAAIEEGTLPSLPVHRAHLQLLFLNLVGNAIKYRRADVSPIVRISAEPQDQYWLFAVSDNGIGIELQYGERIFGLFKRLHTGDQYSGTGIGLAICKRIVELYHGRIWVESSAGQGSRFLFTLPRA